MAKVFAAADYLQMEDLKKRCEHVISSNFQDDGRGAGSVTETERQVQKLNIIFS